MIALDAAPQTLAIAKQRVPTERVHFVEGDAYDLSAWAGECDAAFAGFWFSHVPRRRQREFLRGLCQALLPGSVVVMVDNRFVAGSNLPIIGQDEEGNTYQTRQLTDGSRHRVLKNFPEPAELLQLLAELGLGEAAAVQQLTHYWVLQFTTPSMHP